MNQYQKYQATREGLDASRPVIRSVLAFLVYLRFGNLKGVSDCYQTADRFLGTLDTDLRP